MTVSDFLFLNPEVYFNCTNLLLGVSYCVFLVGDIKSYSGYQAPPTLSITVSPATFSSVNTAILSATNQPNPDFVFQNLLKASGTADDCTYYTDYVANTTDVSLNSCTVVASSWDAELEDFLDWNPSLPRDGSTCALQPGHSYCAQKGETSTRSSVDSRCMDVHESEIHNDADSSCTCFTSVSGYYRSAGLTCEYLAEDSSITLGRLVELNPWLGSDCDSALFAGLGDWDYCAVCIGTKRTRLSGSTVSTATTARPTKSSTSSSTSVATSTPTPIQAGMTKNCNSFYYVKSGDGCYDIADQHRISLNDFYSYNPAVGDDCSKLWPDYYVCVGVADTESCSVDVTFQTTYSTEWGESVWVVGSVPELGSWDVTKALMLTGSSGADGETNWQVTAKFSSNTQVSYKFIKLQIDGTPVWEQDPNRDFQTSSCGGPTIQEGGVWHDGTVAPTVPACTSLDVVFEVTAKTAFGEAVYVIGSVPALGEWSTDAAVMLAADEYTEANPLWKGTISLGVGQDVQYKFIKIGLDGSFTWEADPNRMVTIPTECSATPMQSGAFQQ
jgi:hypothetical protein